jgi:methyl-accepting chemotaxis protein
MDPWAEILLAVFLCMWIIIGLGMLIAILYAALKIKWLVNRINERVAPITKRVEETVTKVTGAAQAISEQAQDIAATARNTADHVAATARETVDHVALKIESTSEVLRDTVVAPAIGINSIIAGVRRASAALRERWSHRGEPAAAGETEDD